MKSKFLTWVSAVSAVALVSGILIVSANAHIGASHTPLNTDGPDLLSASLDGDNVDYCFDENIDRDPSGSAGDFWITGYDSETEVTGASADFDDDDDLCVEVSFAAVVEREENFTVAGVDEDAVEADDDTNPQGSVALDGSTAGGSLGHTVAPNLVGFDENETANQITYDFDEPVDCEGLDTAGDADNFGYYDEDEAAVTSFTRQGTSIDDCDDDNGEVTVGFGAGNVHDVVRVFVEDSTAGANTNNGGDSGTTDDVCEEDPVTAGNGDGCTRSEGFPTTGDVDDAPDLTDIERTDDDEWTFTFDEDLDEAATALDHERFVVYEDDGTPLEPATAGDCQADETEQTVECSYADAMEDSGDEEYPLATAEDCAVQSADDVCSTVGSAPTGTSEEDAGFTDAPDLETVDIDPAGELVAFNFDDPVDDDPATAYDEGDFFVIAPDGDTTSGSDVDDVDGNTITIEYEDDGDKLEEAVGAGVVDGTAEDFQENVAVATTVGAEAPSSAPPSTSTTTTTTTSTTTTTTGTGGGGTKKTATTLTIRYDRDANTFKGSAGSARKGCQRGRLVTLKQQRPGADAKKGSDTTNRAGNWKVRRRARKGKWYAKVAKKVYTARNGDKIVCLTDKSPTIKL